MQNNKKNDFKETILIVDGYHLLHKGYYGSLKRKKVATNRDGLKINAIYTFISKINEIIDKNIYRTIIVTLDVDRACWRRTIYPNYKAKRKETPEDLIPQMQIIRDFLTQANIPWYEKENYEGDDVMGTITRIATKIGYNVHILSNDKDCYQLINQNVKVISRPSRKEKVQFIDEDGVMEKFGCKPSQVADIKSLMGDPSDNIKGVRYLHYQTAIDLLNKYDNVETMLDHLNEISMKNRPRLEKHADQILMNKKIATICQNLNLGRIEFRPLKINWYGYINFLKENRMYVYMNYARIHLKNFNLKSYDIVLEKQEKIFNFLRTKKVVQQENLPTSCNAFADYYLLSHSKGPFNLQDFNINSKSWRSNN